MGRTKLSTHKALRKARKYAEQGLTERAAEAVYAGMYWSDKSLSLVFTDDGLPFPIKQADKILDISRTNNARNHYSQAEVDAEKSGRWRLYQVDLVLQEAQSAQMGLGQEASPALQEEWPAKRIAQIRKRALENTSKRAKLGMFLLDCDRPNIEGNPNGWESQTRMHLAYRQINKYLSQTL